VTLAQRRVVPVTRRLGSGQQTITPGTTPRLHYLLSYPPWPRSCWLRVAGRMGQTKRTRLPGLTTTPPFLALPQPRLQPHMARWWSTVRSDRGCALRHEPGDPLAAGSASLPPSPPPAIGAPWWHLWPTADMASNRRLIYYYNHRTTLLKKVTTAVTRRVLPTQRGERYTVGSNVL